MVIAADIDRAGGEKVAEEISGAGGRATYHHVDVRDVQSVQEMVDATSARHGRFDALFHNAVSVPLINKHDNRATEIEDDIWRQIIDLVLTGTYYCTKYSARQMLKQGSGSIVLTATVDALIGQVGIDAYTAAKGGVVSLTRSLAAGISPEGVRINAVCPGFVDTPHQAGFLRVPEERAKLEELHLMPILQPGGHRALRGVPGFGQGALHDRGHPCRRFGIHRHSRVRCRFRTRSGSEIPATRSGRDTRP